MDLAYPGAVGNGGVLRLHGWRRPSEALWFWGLWVGAEGGGEGGLFDVVVRRDPLGASETG